MFAIGSVFGRVLPCALASLTLSVSVAAQDAAPQTRLGQEGFESPPASFAQMEWLVGQWSGEGIGGAPAMESWLPPTGPVMVGTFVQQNEDASIMFTEHLYLMEEDGTLVLRLKHFNADLTGWEEKDDMLAFRLVAIEECAAYFNALTLRCADPEAPGEGLVAAVRMKSGAELVFNFTADDPRRNSVCPDAMTTIDMNECYAGLGAAASARRADYFAAAIEREIESAQEMARLRGLPRPDLSIVAEMRESEAAFDTYLESECGAVWESYKEGTIRTVMSLACQIELIDARTQTIWENWLTYPDSTPAIRPKPEPTL